MTLMKVKAVVTGSKLTDDKYQIIQIGKATLDPDEIDRLLGVIEMKGLGIDRVFLPRRLSKQFLTAIDASHIIYSEEWLLSESIMAGNHTLMVAYFQEKENINLRFFIQLKTGNTTAVSQLYGIEQNIYSLSSTVQADFLVRQWFRYSVCQVSPPAKTSFYGNGKKGLVPYGDIGS